MPSRHAAMWIRVMWLFGAALVVHAQSSAPVTVSASSSRIVLTNGYVRVEVNLGNPCIDVLQADSLGQLPPANQPAGNVLNLLGRFNPKDALKRQGIALERDSRSASNQWQQFASTAGAGSSFKAMVQSSTPGLAVVVLSGIVDSVNSSVVSATWTLSLARGSHAFSLATSTTVLAAVPVAAVRTSFYFAPPSVFGFFRQRGVVQVCFAL